MKPGSALDTEARKRGNSTYLVDRVIPMLPEALSNGWCSLKPDLQFISNPGGDSSADDAWVAAVRLEFGI